MNPFLLLVLLFMVLGWLLELLAGGLNLRHASPQLPAEFSDLWDPERYRRSQAYLRANTRFDRVSSTLTVLAMIGFILLGGFGWIDRFAREFGLGPIPTGLLFGALLVLGGSLLGLPFSAWATFGIEARFGFNRTSVRTFVLDLLKSWVVVAILGGTLFVAVLWIFGALGPLAWLVCWGAVGVFQIFVAFIAPVLLLPLFYKLAPLEAGPLRQAIEGYARAQGFALRGVFVMDGSRRSAKSNAFFTGIGRSKRIVLYDTRVAQHPPEEILAILAHEVGHYRRRHVPLRLGLSLALMGLMLYLASRFLDNRALLDAFGVREPSVHAGLVLFAFLYAPLGRILGVLGNALSRRQEREADRFAAETTGMPAALAAALKRLSRDNLTNLTPHPFVVALHHGHPPVLERIRALGRMGGDQR